MSSRPTYYLAALDLTDRSCLVVGAGRIALEKIHGLLACDARVLVVAPEAVPDVQKLADEGAIALERRGYRAGDLDDCMLAIAATDDTPLNETIYRDATERSMLVNVVDVPALCTFILPAIVREGPVAIGISTAGTSPALAKRMKRESGAMFGPEYARLAEMLDAVRPWAKQHLATYDDRREFFESIVNGQPDPIEMLKEGDDAGVQALIERHKEGAA